MTEPRLCPFCNGVLIKFGRDMDYASHELVDVYIHPELSDEINRCPLTRLVFKKADWDKRPIEDALRVELGALAAERNTANLCGSLLLAWKTQAEIELAATQRDAELSRMLCEAAVEVEKQLRIDLATTQHVADVWQAENKVSCNRIT